MNVKKESKKKSETLDVDKPIYQRISDKHKRLSEIHGSLAMWLATPILMVKKIKVRELQDRLDFRVMEAEENLLDVKIGIYQQALDILKKDV